MWKAKIPQRTRTAFNDIIIVVVVKLNKWIRHVRKKSIERNSFAGRVAFLNTLLKHLSKTYSEKKMVKFYSGICAFSFSLKKKLKS